MKKIVSIFFKWLKRIIIAFFILSILSTILFRFIPVPITPLMLIRCVEQIADGKMPKIDKDWKPIDKISSNMVLAVIASEDQKFEEHFGFDIDAIEKAMKQNAKLQKRGKPIKGGSTISQQCAKNVFLFPQRSWIRKGFEVYFTFLIEVFWSKERIMEVYLNVIETGDGIYGAQAAARNFFNKDAIKLTPSEAATIAAVLPNPRRWSAKNPSTYILKRKRWIMRQMSHLNGSVDL
ncbi:MAG: monofunctional biosynthetic peptidoglycan transglycosylase [Bacteroidetes bacterium]|nr:monofunctional biosynthetic peptidoglycan transglycosylase [Bacteroidota bacterium]